jgi:anti-anti-sigma regulatory factor
MLQHESRFPATDRPIVTIDLIGDLDARLGKILAETLGELARRGDCDVRVSFRRVAIVRGDGLAGTARAFAQAQLAGCPIRACAVPRDRLVRAALKSSRIPFEEANPAWPSFGGRHIMIAGHSKE